MVFVIVKTVLVLTAINGVLAVLLVIAERFLANYGVCTITVNDEKVLSVQGGVSLLSALGSQKIFLPSACGGRGTCAYCKCRVEDGAGPHLPTELPMLTESEIKDQIRLACQVKVKQDLKIRIPEELFQIQEYQAEVANIRDLTHDIKLVRLRLLQPEAIHFKAGQYVQLESQPYNGVKERVQRAYSIASPAYESSAVDLMIRLVPDGICTTWVHEVLKEGDRVKIVGPMGDFFLREADGEIVMVAGGSGMAPMVSLLSDMAKNKTSRKATYFFGALTTKDLFYLDEMKQYEKEIPNFRFVPALSEPAPEDDWHGETGLITKPLDAYLSSMNPSQAQGYLCGSPGMIHACIKVMIEKGMDEKQIFFDPFS